MTLLPLALIAVSVFAAPDWNAPCVGYEPKIEGWNLCLPFRLGAPTRDPQALLGRWTVLYRYSATETGIHDHFSYEEPGVLHAARNPPRPLRFVALKVSYPPMFEFGAEQYRSRAASARLTTQQRGDWPATAYDFHGLLMNVPDPWGRDASGRFWIKERAWDRIPMDVFVSGAELHLVLHVRFAVVVYRLVRAT